MPGVKRCVSCLREEDFHNDKVPLWYFAKCARCGEKLDRHSLRHRQCIIIHGQVPGGLGRGQGQI